MLFKSLPISAQGRRSAVSLERRLEGLGSPIRFKAIEGQQCPILSIKYSKENFEKKSFDNPREGGNAFFCTGRYVDVGKRIQIQSSE